jgi:long-chain acyl-CoA synthetase
MASIPEQSPEAYKRWLRNYPPGVPQEIDVNAYRSLGEFFEISAARYRERCAYVGLGRSLSYGELAKLAHDFAGYLQGDLRLRKGDRVALMLPNVLHYPVCVFAALRLGLIVVNINPLYTPRELQCQLRDSGAQTIVILENLTKVLRQVIPRTAVRHVIVARVGDFAPFPKSALINLTIKFAKYPGGDVVIDNAVTFKSALKHGARAQQIPVHVEPDDVAFLQYTGGTTGTSKGAMLTHRNMIANLEQSSAWFSPLIEGRPVVAVAALPLYHIFGLMANCLVFVKFGGTNLLIVDPRNIRGFVRLLRKHPFSIMTGVNTLFNALLANPGFARADFSHLRLSVGSGMAVHASVAKRWKQITGCPIVQAYGLTEASPAVAINPVLIKEFSGSIGVPVPSTDVRIRDAQGHDLPPGQVGELFVRGPQVMKGYWNQPEETQAVLAADGFLATGDLGKMDDTGFITLVDRKKDMILVSGFNVYPTEIEDVATMHPGVREAAAVGVADNATGEAVKLFVIKRFPELTEAELKRHCREHLTSYKVPKTIVFRDELPKSNVGKILRRALRDQ